VVHCTPRGCDRKSWEKLEKKKKKEKKKKSRVEESKRRLSEGVDVCGVCVVY
jgi:hypothetical protein